MFGGYLRAYTALFIFLSAAGPACAAEVDAARAQQNYMLNCQGCHLHDASGFPGKIPNMQGFVGNFLHIQGGREFIVQVPGVANAPLSDAELAEVMNWLLTRFSAAQLPADHKPYTAKEVARLRRTALIDVGAIREGLIEKMQRELQR